MNRSIPWWLPEIGKAEAGLVLEVLESNYINEGDVTERFERQLADLLDAKFAVATTSGTAAIALALAGLGIGRDDEVLVPDITFIATANAVTLIGGRPILVDVDPRTLTIDVAAAERAITPRTKAIIPVHVSGRGADMRAVTALAQRRQLRVVEDAAEALSSKHHGRFLGTFGDAGCFSFSPNKTITTGQGGLIVTDDERLHVRLRELKDQGRPVRGTGGDDVHDRVGFNFKMTNLQAAVGLAQLQYLPARLARQKAIYRRYAARLSHCRDFGLPGFDVDAGESPQWVDAVSPSRDALEAGLREQGIQCRKFWFPLHTQKPYARPHDAFPNSTTVGPQALWLPSAFQLSDADVDHVCDCVQQLLERRR